MGYGVAISSLFRKAREENADIMITLDGMGSIILRTFPT